MKAFFISLNLHFIMFLQMHHKFRKQKINFVSSRRKFNKITALDFEVAVVGLLVVFVVRATQPEDLVTGKAIF